MHCASCESLIERKFLEMSGVTFADADFGQKKIEVEFKSEQPDLEKINKVFKENGYTFFDKKPEEVKQHSNNIFYPLLVAAIFIVVFLFISKISSASFLSINSSSSFSAFVMFGILAGVSSCAALIGGLILSLSKQWVEKYGQGQSLISKAKPHLLFNSGRLISYTLVGALLGLVGESFKISTTTATILIIFVSVIMLVLALQMLGVRALDRLRLTVPKGIAGMVTQGDKKVGRFTPFIIGFFTFLLPCGFTLAAEGVAILSGDMIHGAWIMFGFALGTAVPLLVIGFSSTKLLSNHKTADVFLKTAGFLILFFVLYNLNFQFGLDNYFLDKLATAPTNISTSNQVSSDVGKQIIKTDYYDQRDIVPSVFTVKKGQPVKFIVTVHDNGYGCMSTIMIPGLWDRPLRLRKNTVLVMEFTPQKVGSYEITCAMGVPRGSFNVIE